MEVLKLSKAQRFLTEKLQDAGFSVQILFSFPENEEFIEVLIQKGQVNSAFQKELISVMEALGCTYKGIKHPRWQPYHLFEANEKSLAELIGD